MRAFLFLPSSLFLLQRLGRLGLQRRRRAAVPDRADMGTEFGLEAALAADTPAPVASGQAPSFTTTATAEPPLAWLERLPARRPG